MKQEGIVVFVLKTKWELFALVCAGHCCVIKGVIPFSG